MSSRDTSKKGLDADVQSCRYDDSPFSSSADAARAQNRAEHRCSS